MAEVSSWSGVCSLPGWRVLPACAVSLCVLWGRSRQPPSLVPPVVGLQLCSAFQNTRAREAAWRLAASLQGCAGLLRSTALMPIGSLYKPVKLCKNEVGYIFILLLAW